METSSRSLQLGKEDAREFISNERIDYQPFVALSDMHLVRKTVPVTYQAMRETVTALDQELWILIEASADRHAETHEDAFNADDYALGFVAGVAAVWDTIRDRVL